MLKLTRLTPPNPRALTRAPTSASPLSVDDVGLKSGAPATQKARFGQNRAMGGDREWNVDGVTALRCIYVYREGGFCFWAAYERDRGALSPNPVVWHADCLQPTEFRYDSENDLCLVFHVLHCMFMYGCMHGFAWKHGCNPWHYCCNFVHRCVISISFHIWQAVWPQNEFFKGFPFTKWQNSSIRSNALQSLWWL